MSRVSNPANAGTVARLAIAGLAMAWVVNALPAAAEPIKVMVDRAKVMHVSRPAHVVIVGNPAIADATIQDAQTLIITGHSFGSTNLIVLDSDGKEIADDVITVGASDDKVVTVYSRTSRQTYSCSPDCMPTLAIGDTSSVFDAVNQQITAHGSLSTNAANNK